MILNDIITQLQMAAPEDFAQDWDNVGLLVGDRKQDIQKIFIALDANETAIAQAKAVGAQLLLTHHPLIFSPLKKVNCDNFISARVVDLLRSQMSYYAMHTNFDAAKMGELAAERMDLNVEAPLADIFTRDGKDYGIGVVGSLKESETLGGLCAVVKEAFGLDTVKLFREETGPISRVAICPGSGKSYIKKAVKMGADVYITGDIDHHSGLDAVEQSMCIIDAGHFGLEHIFVPYMKEYLERKLPALTVYAAEQQAPFEVI